MATGGRNWSISSGELLAGVEDDGGCGKGF